MKRAALLLLLAACSSDPEPWKAPPLPGSSAVNLKHYEGLSMIDLHEAALEALRNLRFEITRDDLGHAGTDEVSVVEGEFGDGERARIVIEPLGSRTLLVSVAVSPLNEPRASEIQEEISLRLALPAF